MIQIKNIILKSMIYLLYLININVGYLLISSFYDFQDDFDLLIVIGIQLHKNKNISKLKMLPGWLMLLVMFIGTDYKCNTSVNYHIRLDYSFKKWTNIFSSLKSTLRINTCALKHFESSFLKKTCMRQSCLNKEKCS